MERATRRKDSSNRVAVEDRVGAFKMYAQGFTLKAIAKETGCHVNTIKRYRKEDDWDERLNKIYDKVLDNCELDLVKSIEQTLNMTQTFKHKFAIRLRTISPSMIPVTMMTHLKELFEMEQELIGSLQAASDTGELTLYNEDQLEGMLRDDEPDAA